MVQDDPAIDPRTTARRRAGDAARRLVTQLLLADASAEELDRVAEGAEELAARLGPSAGASRYDVPLPDDAYMETHPLLGPANAVAPPLTRADTDDAVVILGSFDNRFEGPPGLVHGGFVDFGFEFVLGAAAASTGRRAFTGSITVMYRKPLRVGTPVRFVARVDRVDGRKILSKAELTSGETLCAEATSVHLAVDEATWTGGARP